MPKNKIRSCVIRPTIITEIRIIAPIMREKVLKTTTSAILLISNPFPKDKLYLFQGAKTVLNKKGIEK